MLKLALAPFVLVAYGLVGWPRDALRSALARRRLRSARKIVLIG
jgi:hypothetical protein